VTLRWANGRTDGRSDNAHHYYSWPYANKTTHLNCAHRHRYVTDTTCMDLCYATWCSCWESNAYEIILCCYLHVSEMDPPRCNLLNVLASSRLWLWTRFSNREGGLRGKTTYDLGIRPIWSYGHWGFLIQNLPSDSRNFWRRFDHESRIVRLNVRSRIWWQIPNKNHRFRISYSRLIVTQPHLD